MKPEIKELHKLTEEELEASYEMMIRSFRNYPKLIGTFPDWDDRQAAIEMVLRYYGAFDFAYGNVYSTDENIDEVMMIMYSEEEDYTKERFDAAGSDNEKFRQAASRLSDEQVKRWWDFFDELDRKEEKLTTIPEHCLYVDFLCVRSEVQGQGRGSKIIRAACRYADEVGLPIMLFTNGEEDVRFYLKNGFRIIGVTTSEEFGFENTYVLYEPESAAAESGREAADER